MMIKKSLVCIVYVSDSRLQIISKLKEIISNHSSVFLAHSFIDEPYNRTSFFLTGIENNHIADCALSLCETAISLLDYSQHTGMHPTLGTVDHISFSPLGDETTDTAALIANNFAKSFNKQYNIPVFLYGHASSNQNKLKDIRRNLGYFDKDVEKKCLNWSNDCIPDYNINELNEPDPTRGVSTIGAVPLVLNFNMRFRKIDERNQVIKVTKAVRNISPTIEALTLPHEKGFEVACNLLNTKECGPDQVLPVAQETANDLDLLIEESYCTGPKDTDLLTKLNQWITDTKS